MGKSLAAMTAEIREVNVAHGWRPADGGPGANTFGDYLALLHSELSEALEAYRDHRLADATAKACPTVGGECFVHGRSRAECGLPKPEGVGSEFADVLIRLLDMCDVFGLKPFYMDREPTDVDRIYLAGYSFGDHIALLHFQAATSGRHLGGFLRALVTVAAHYRIDLTAEYERKIAYNRTRPYQHGGRTLAGEKGSA
jgi:NTP pyrophosphatase (non-canonical NTP hydrolase)